MTGMGDGNGRDESSAANVHVETLRAIIEYAADHAETKEHEDDIRRDGVIALEALSETAMVSYARCEHGYSQDSFGNCPVCNYGGQPTTPLCGAKWPTPCEDCVGSCGIEEFIEAQEASAATTPGNERHIQGGDPEAVVEVMEDGSVGVTIGEVTYLTAERLGEIVAFVETHAQIQVVERDA